MLAKHQIGTMNGGGAPPAELFRSGERPEDAAPGERILPILWRRKFLLLLCTAVAVGTTVLYLRRAVPLYSSTARVCIEQSVVPFEGTAIAAPLSGNYIATQAEVIKSTNVLELAESKLEALKTTSGTPRELQTFAGESRFISDLQTNLMVQLDPKVDIIDVSFTSPYPEEAADIVNTVVDAYKDFHQQVTHHDSSEVLAAAEAEKKKREAELAKAVKDLNELRKLHPTVGSTGSSQATSAQLTALTNAFSQAQIQTADAEATFAPNHPAIAAARRQEQKLGQLLAQARKDTAEQDSAKEDLVQSEQDVTRLRDQVDQADKRVKDAAAVCANDNGGARINVVEDAHPELAPVRPRKTQLLALSAVLGLMLGGAAALALEWADQRISGPQDTVAILRAPILGIVPLMKGGDEAPMRGRHVHLDPMSLVSEAYRTIRTAICFGVHGDAGRTVLVTSPAPGDGKSTTAANLAIAMTQSGERVLLIDADMRKPVQHVMFGMNNGLGLSSALAGNCSAHQAIQPTTIRGLDVLTSGPTPGNPAEVLTRKAFVLLLQEVAGEYDRVILDSPPVTTVSDTLTLAAFCDITVLTLRAGKSTRSLAAATRDSLLSVNANIFGIVINGGTVARSGYSVYGTYGAPTPTALVRATPRSFGNGVGGDRSWNGYPGTTDDRGNGTGNGEMTALVVKSEESEPEEVDEAVIEHRPLSGTFHSGFPIRPTVPSHGQDADEFEGKE